MYFYIGLLTLFGGDNITHISKNIGIIFIIAIVIASGLFAPTSAQHAEKEWTVLTYFVAETDGFSANGIYWDLMEMDFAGSNASTNVVAYFDGLGEGNTRYFEMGDGNPESRYGEPVLLDYIVPDFESMNITDVTPQGLVEEDSGDAMSLIRFLRWGMENYPAEHYAVVLADHGWGHDGMCYDDTSRSHLSLVELRGSFATVAYELGRPLDLICLDACLMGHLSVLYQLAPYCDYACASQQSELVVPPDLSTPYQFDMALPFPEGTSAEDAACRMVEHVSDDHGINTLSAVDMGGVFTSLVSAVDALSTELYTNYGTYSAAIEAARSATEYYPFNVELYVDIYDFAYNLKDQGVCTAECQAVMDAVDAAVVCEHHGTVLNLRAHGIGMFLPRQGVAGTFAEYYAYLSRFGIDLHWSDLVFYWNTYATFGLETGVLVMTDPAMDSVSYDETIALSGFNLGDMHIDFQDGYDITTLVTVANTTTGEQKEIAPDPSNGMFTTDIGLCVGVNIVQVDTMSYRIGHEDTIFDQKSVTLIVTRKNMLAPPTASCSSIVHSQLQHTIDIQGNVEVALFGTEPSQEVQNLLDEAGMHMKNATQLTNAVYANGELLRAASILEQVLVSLA